MIRRNERHGNSLWPCNVVGRVPRTVAAATLLAALWGVLACDTQTHGATVSPAQAGPILQPLTPPRAPEANPDPALFKIDVHMHIAPDAADLALRLMREAHIVVGLNASGGTPDEGLAQSSEIALRSGGRLLPLCNFDLSRALRPAFASYVESTLKACKSLGGLGLKIPKSLGLGVRDGHGVLLAIDDPRLDPLFEAAGTHGLPVLIHSGDPQAFFRAPTSDNERYAELLAHPGWSFFGLAANGQPWPSWGQIFDAFERRVARHPGTQFLGAHFGNAAEEPERVASMLARFPNYFIDTAARVPEFGRHSAAAMRAFFIAHQDRILFGSDLGVMRNGLVLGSSGASLDVPSDAPRFFDVTWRYFETMQSGIAHPTPIQGNWTVDGIGLPKTVLEKLYWRNAVRLFSLPLPREQTASSGN
jgi:predicted TIM-barrel fold metal-dependent hydrolase